MKYEVSRSNTFRVIALQRKCGQTDRRTDRRTDRVITIGLPHLRWRDPNNELSMHAKNEVSICNSSKLWPRLKFFATESQTGQKLNAPEFHSGTICGMTIDLFGINAGLMSIYAQWTSTGGQNKAKWCQIKSLFHYDVNLTSLFSPKKRRSRSYPRTVYNMWNNMFST